MTCGDHFRKIVRLASSTPGRWIPWLRLPPELFCCSGGLESPLLAASIMNTRTRTRLVLRLKQLLKIVLICLLGLGVAVALRAHFAFRDRLPGYYLSLNVTGERSAREPRPFQVGMARSKITPEMDPKRPVWLAGFSQHRAATAVHDDLWAVAAVLDDGWSRVGIVALDAIGFFEEDVVQVRRALPPDLKIDFTIVHSTHNHSTPDLMGLWGPSLLRTGVDPAYRNRVIDACVSALSRAAMSLKPARVAFHEIPTSPEGLVSDTRKPIVFDADIRVMHFVRTDDGTTIGSIVNWADHPETLWGENTEITSDFCGYLRDALESGVTSEGRQVLNGVGGIHMYVNGAVGGLMSTTPSTTVHDPFLNRDYREPSHDKARALGRQLAQRIIPALQATNAAFATHVPIGFAAQTIELRLDNKGYLLAGFLGLIDRGHVKWRTLRSEVGLVTLGDASIACIPGEAYPELVNGGIEKAPGGDFQIDPVEVPPVRELMPGKVKFVLGLANDEIGYLVPKSEWDEKPPYLYGAKSRPYGEVNSVGPDAAGTVHGALKELCLKARQQSLAAAAGVPEKR